MKKLFLRFTISLLIGGAMLYLASKEIDFGTTWSALARMNWWVLGPYFGVMAVQHFFRAWRWGQLLAPIQLVPFSRILPIASVGFLAIVALPLRMGELVRPYLIVDRPRIRMSHGLGTMAVERVFDGLILSLCAFVAVMIARAHTEVPNWVFVAGLVAMAIFCTALVVLIMALWQKDRAVSLCRKLFGLISSQVGDKLAHVAEGVVDGFRVLPDLRRLLLFIMATLAYWFFNGMAVWVLGFGFDIGLSLWEAYAVMTLVGIGIMIPAGPGFIGNFELFAEGALGMYVSKTVRNQRGAAFILTFHATNALWYAVTGFIAMLSPQVRFTHVLRASTSVSNQLDPDGEEVKKLDKPSGPSDAGSARAPADY